ncbi:MAG: hypothetical protein ACR2J4_07785, partial [Deinococcus sp.]
MFEDIMRQMSGTAEMGQQFTQAHQSGQYDSVDPQHAADYVQQFVQNAPPEAQQQVFQEYVQGLSPEQRQGLAQVMAQHPGTPVQQVNPNDDQDLSTALTSSSQALSGGNAGGIGGLFGMLGSVMGGGQGGSSQMGGMGQGQMG